MPQTNLSYTFHDVFPIIDGKVELDLAARDHREACRIMAQMLWEKGSLHQV